jgi:hypothetical protein
VAVVVGDLGEHLHDPCLFLFRPSAIHKNANFEISMLSTTYKIKNEISKFSGRISMLTVQ